MSESVNQPFEPASSADSAATADLVVPGGTGPTPPADLVPGAVDATARGAVPRRRGPRRAVRRGTEREAVLGVSADERPAGWSEGADGGGAAGAGQDSNDEQLRRDVPPHWG
ncbi:hypothetical protein [Promicromonospora sp. NPDC060271]|uniref:hypothetical protein n=1 Tax=Promicromonospora sp. NPDC060271 TaxID=3347089 RepID=UPI00364CDF45